MTASFLTYLSDVNEGLRKKFPDNRTVNIICHGHSVPTGYFASPLIDPFHAYPHLLHRLVKERFPYAAVNVIVTSIGGENSEQGAKRFARDVMTHQPDVITIDYALNDRGLGLSKAEKAWREMIEKALDAQKKVILMTPTWDRSFYEKTEDFKKLTEHAEQIKRLSKEYEVGLADSFGRFEEYVQRDEDLADLLSHVNHPTHTGHQLVARELAKYFIA